MLGGSPKGELRLGGVSVSEAEFGGLVRVSGSSSNGASFAECHFEGMGAALDSFSSMVFLSLPRDLIWLTPV